MAAAEIVRRRADAGKANMGLTAWKRDRVIKRDVGTAKNYLDAQEIDTLNRITVMFPDQAEFRAQRRRLAAEAEAETQYVEDLRTSAKMLETRRKKQPTKKKKPPRSRNKDGGKGPGKGAKS